MINREVAIANELSQSHVNKISILSYFKPSYKSLKLSPRINVYHIIPAKYYDILYENVLVYPLIFLLLLFKFRRLKPDYVFVDLHQEAMWALFFRRIFGYKVCFTYHGVADPKFFPAHIGTKLEAIKSKTYKLLKKADRVFVVSQFLQKELQNQGILSTVVHNGVDPDFFNPQQKIHNLQSKGPILLFMGRYSEFKGALNVVKAFVLVKQSVPDAELILHGFWDSDSYVREIRRTINEGKLEDSCYLFGPVEWSEVPFKINQCDLFLNGSLDESFAMPLLEAQACGKPCVAFRAGGVPEVVKDEISGFLAPQDDITGFAERVVRLLKDKQLYNTLASNALANSQNFTYKEIASELAECIGVSE